MSENNLKLEKLPKNIPAITDKNLFLLPGAEVILKAKGLELKDIVDFSFKNSDRYVSICNSIDLESSKGKIATIGKIVKFVESDNQQYIISVRGVIRFHIVESIEVDKNVNILIPDYTNFIDDLFINKLIFKDRDYIDSAIKEYFVKTNNTVLNNINLKEVTDIKLLSLLANQLKFNQYERSKLLTASNSEEINNFITHLLEYELAIVESRTEAKH